jgi:hypothetical protein
MNRRDIMDIRELLNHIRAGVSDHRGNLCHLVAIWLRVLSFQGMPTLAATLWADVVTVLELLRWNQLPSCAFMARLPPSLAFALGTLARFWRNVMAVAGRRLGGIARVAVDPLTQGRHLRL